MLVRFTMQLNNPPLDSTAQRMPSSPPPKDTQEFDEMAGGLRQQHLFQSRRGASIGLQFGSLDQRIILIHTRRAAC